MLISVNLKKKFVSPRRKYETLQQVVASQLKNSSSTKVYTNLPSYQRDKQSNQRSKDPLTTKTTCQLLCQHVYASFSSVNCNDILIY